MQIHSEVIPDVVYRKNAASMRADNSDVLSDLLPGVRLPLFGVEFVFLVTLSWVYESLVRDFLDLLSVWKILFIRSQLIMREQRSFQMVTLKLV
jgi:hypothetical protein